VHHLTTLDWIALGIVALSAVAGWRRGLIASALSLGGLVAGAYAGSRVAPHLLNHGSASQWTPLAGLVGAIVGATLGQAVASLAGSFVRGGLRLTPFRLLDSLGGLVFGAAAGLAFVWVFGATALLLPGQTQLRQAVQRSQIVRRLNEAVPPHRLLHLLARIDPFPSIAGPAAPNEPPSRSVLRDATIRRASRAVVRVLGTACGIGVEGSGWFARGDLVVTAAHVVAGQHDTVVELQSGARIPAQPVAFDTRNDIAVLHVDGLGLPPLRLVPARSGAAVAVLGFPENGPFTATPARIGRTSVVLAEDAYGRGPVTRAITSLGGLVRHGDSGAPAVDAQGAVESTVFAARLRTVGGYGVPDNVVRTALNRARGPVSTGDCAP
jgi:S1-C subfamily serine protease